MRLPVDRLRLCEKPSEEGEQSSSDANNRPLVVIKKSGGLFEDQDDSPILAALFLASVFILATVIATSPMGNKRPRQDNSGQDKQNWTNHD